MTTDSETTEQYLNFVWTTFLRVSYAETRLSYTNSVCLSVRPSVRHSLVLYQNG